MIPGRRGDHIDPEYECRTVLSAEMIRAVLLMLHVKTATSIET